MALLTGEEPQDPLSAATEVSLPRRWLDARSGPRPRWGAIQAAVLIVLGEAAVPLRVREVHAPVEQCLKPKISYHTVCSFLATVANAPGGEVERVRCGTYRARRHQA